MLPSVVAWQVQVCLSLEVEGQVGLRVVVASAYPRDTRDRLDHRSQETEGVAADEREGDNPMVMGMLAFVVDFRQVVDPT